MKLCVQDDVQTWVKATWLEIVSHMLYYMYHCWIPSHLQAESWDLKLLPLHAYPLYFSRYDQITVLVLWSRSAHRHCFSMKLSTAPMLVFLMWLFSSFSCLWTWRWSWTPSSFLDDLIGPVPQDARWSSAASGFQFGRTLRTSCISSSCSWLVPWWTNWWQILERLGGGHSWKGQWPTLK